MRKDDRHFFYVGAIEQLWLAIRAAAWNQVASGRKFIRA
jgi:hypothetical protein